MCRHERNQRVATQSRKDFYKDRTLRFVVHRTVISLIFGVFFLGWPQIVAASTEAGQGCGLAAEKFGEATLQPNERAGVSSRPNRQIEGNSSDQRFGDERDFESFIQGE